MAQNGIGSRSKRGSSVASVSSLESRLQDLGLSRVVRSSPSSGGATEGSSGVGRAPSQGRPASSAGRILFPKSSSQDAGEADAGKRAGLGPQSNSAEGKRGGGYREGSPGRPAAASGRAQKQEKPSSKSPMRDLGLRDLGVKDRESSGRVQGGEAQQSSRHDGEGGRGGAHAPLRSGTGDSAEAADEHHGGGGKPEGAARSHSGGRKGPLPPQPPQQQGSRSGRSQAPVPEPRPHHYQFCPNCGFQLVDSPVIAQFARPGAPPVPPGTVLASAVPATSSDEDSDSSDEGSGDEANAARPQGRGAALAAPLGSAQGGSGRKVPGSYPPRPAPPTGQADLAAGKGSVASAAILKEMEGRRAQRLKQPGGDVVGQGKGIRGVAKGVAVAQEPDGGAAGKHRRIGSVDHNIYSSAMPVKKGPVDGAEDSDAQGADASGGPAGAPGAAKKRGVPPLPSKSAGAHGAPRGPSGAAPKRPEPAKGLQISVGAEGGQQDDAAGPEAGRGAEGQMVASASVASGAYSAAMPSPGHRRISSWADGGNLKHTDFILRKPYRDVTDVYDVHDEELGVGQFGVIRSCVNRATGLLLACKTISKERIVCIEDADDVRKEVQLMQQLRGHPNIIDLHETFEDSKHVHLVMELCKGGELFDRIKMRGQYTERNAALVLATLVEALIYCHSNGIVHRDIKPENILLMKKEDDSVIKVIDFGVAARFRHGEVLTEFVGTPYYMAPEVLVGSYGPEADIWSAGIVLYIMLCGFPPFWGNSNEAIFDAIQRNELQFKSSKWRNVSEPAKDLIRGLLSKDPKKRISSLDILGHPWIVMHSKTKP